MKKNEHSLYWDRYMRTKPFRIMKLSILLMVIFTSVLSAESFSQNELVTLKMQDATVVEIFKEIETQSGLGFFFKSSDFDTNKLYTIDVDQVTVEEVINELFKDDDLSVSYEHKNVIIKKSIEIQQELAITVSGQVVDEKKEPIPGVSIYVKGETNGTITDIDGNYTINNVPNNAVLVFSFIGMKTQEVSVASRMQINVVLENESIGLEEVVAIGYGTMKKKDLTGSVVSMKNEEITIAPTSNVMEALQGKITGMDIVKTSGQIGEDVNILLRGSRSIYGDNTPLFIIDGIPGKYNEINPSDIESVDVLKDASSTAIYGSAGSNGVVIITTKRGREGKATINFDSYYGFSGEPDYFHGMIGDEWTQYQREAYRYLNGQYPADMSAILTDADKLAAYNQGKWIDWVDEVAGNVATDQKYSLSVSGGTEKTKLFTSLAVTKREGLLSNENEDKYAFRLNVDQELFPFAKIGMTSNLTYLIRNNGVSNTFTKAISSFPLGDAYDEFGNINYEFATNEYTPLGDFIEDQYENNLRSTYFNTNAYIDVDLIKGLKLKSVFSTVLSNSRLGQYWGAQCNANRPSYAGTPHAEIDNSYGYGYTWENILSYNKTFAENHSLSATFVTSWSKNQSEGNTAGGSGQNLDSWSYYRLMSATSQNVESNYAQTQKMSYAARLNYSFKGKYLLTVSNRYDGVSWLSTGHKWDNFPAAALGWRVSEEGFMSNTANWLDNLKLRLSYGVTGNSGGIGAYGTTSTPYAYSSWGVSINGEIVPFTQYTGTYGNSSLGWEKSYNYNVGVDFSIYDSVVSGTIEYFNTTTKDLLFKRTMPITSGVTGWGAPLSSWENIAETTNEGVELSINTRNIRTSNFTWNSTFSFTWGKEEIVSLPSGDLIKENLFEGSPIHSLYDYKYKGIWGTSASQETLDTYGVKEGWVMIETVPQEDEEGVSDNGIHKYSENDKQILGHENPDYIIGFNNTLTYKNVDLTVFTMARYGQTIDSDLLGWYTAKSGDSNNQIAGADYWTESNQDAYYPVPGSGSEQTVMSALKFRDGSFIKVKNITLGYTLNKNTVHIPYMEKCRFYVTAYNPFLYVKDKQLKGTDPETNGSDSFPLYKQYVFGVNVTF